MNFGSLHHQYVRCGKSTCKCAQGELHGPYWRRYWREDGVTQSRYVNREQQDILQFGQGLRLTRQRLRKLKRIIK